MTKGRLRYRRNAKSHGRAIPPIPDVAAAARRRSAAPWLPRVRIVPLARVPRLCSRLPTPLAAMHPTARCGRMHTAALQQAAAWNPSFRSMRTASP